MISTTVCLWYSFIRKTALFRNINLLSIENFRLMVTIFFFEFANPCSVWLHPCSEMRLDANAIGLHVWDGCSGWGDATCTPDKSRGSYKKFSGHTRYHTVKVVWCGGHTNCPRRPLAWWATHFSTITLQLFRKIYAIHAGKINHALNISRENFGLSDLFSICVFRQPFTSSTLKNDSSCKGFGGLGSWWSCFR